MNNRMYNANDDGILTSRLRRISTILGILILLISVFLSYDGFDGAVSGRNSDYEVIAIVIGIVLALTVSALQFIFSSSYSQLNTTLKVVGFASYIYSIYTNKLGASNLLQMDEIMSWVVAAFCDIVAEPMIAWGLAESMVGDILGNAGKMVFGDGTGNKNKVSSNNATQGRSLQGRGGQKNVGGQMGRIYQPSSHLAKSQGKPGGDLRRRLEEMRKSKGNAPMGFSSMPQRPEENEEGDDF